MGDDQSIDYPDSTELPFMIKVVEEPDSISRQDRHNVQLQLIDKSGRQSLPRNVCAASDGRVAVTGCHLRGIDRRCNSVGNEDEFDRTPRHRRRRTMSDHEVRHCVRRFISACCVLAGAVRSASDDDGIRRLDEFLDHWTTQLGRIEVPVVQAHISTIGSATNPSRDIAMSSKTLDINSPHLVRAARFHSLTRARRETHCRNVKSCRPMINGCGEPS